MTTYASFAAGAPAGAGAPPTGYALTCLSGPDQGKRALVGPEWYTIGRDAACNVLSDDPDTAERFASFRQDGATLLVQALTATPVFVEGRPMTDVRVLPGQQVRLGRSVWQFAAAVPVGGAPGAGARATPRDPREFVRGLGDRISAAAGVDKAEEFDARELLAEVTRSRRGEELEDHFTCGTRATTPPLGAVDARWPKPWVFARVLAFSLAAFAAFLTLVRTTGNPRLVPGLILIGSFAVPLAVLIFFFEMNVPRNVSVFQLAKLVLLGAVIGFTATLVLDERLGGLVNTLGAMSAGPVEETAKALVLLAVVRKARYPWTLNGLLFGAAVGTGFAAFESAGYAFDVLLESQSGAAMVGNIELRAFLSVLSGHVVWTALVGAALWRVRGDRPFDTGMLTDPRFLRVFGTSVALHVVWNSPLELPFFLKYVAVGAVGWMLALGLVQDGLKQVRAAQVGGGGGVPNDGASAAAAPTAATPPAARTSAPATPAAGAAY